MKMLKKILFSDAFFVLLVVIVGLVLSLWPMFYELLHKNDIFSDRYFVLVYNYAPDFNAYLSKIIQGIQGKWLVSEYFTSEKHMPSLLQIFYLLMGKTGGLFSQNPEFSYHLGRILWGAGWIFSGWWFIKYTFSSRLYRRLSFLLFVFAGNFPKVVADQAGYGFSFLGVKWEQTMVGWSNLDPVRRMTFIPHWNAGHVMTVLSLLLFIKYIEAKNSQEGIEGNFKFQISNFKFNSRILLALSIFFGILAGFILPPTLIIVYAIFGLYIFYWFVLRVLSLSNFFKFLRGKKLLLEISKNYTRHPQNQKDFDQDFTQKELINRFKFLLKSFLIFFVLTFPTLLYNVWITQFYPWKSLVETDLYVNKIIFPYFGYLMALGPVGFMGLIGAFLALFLKKERYLWSSFWVLGMFTLIVIFDKVINWHNQTRFLEVGPELPLAVLSVVFLSFIFSFLGRLKNWLVAGSVFLLLLLAVFLFAISLTAQVDFIKHKMLGSYPALSLGNYVVYPYKTIMEGVFYLKNNTSFSDVILSGDVTGNHIAAYAGRFVYVGHGSQTVRFYQEKVPTAKLFYQGGMDESTAKKFLKDNRISFVFYGPEEKTWGEYPEQAGFLKKMFENSEVKIYKVEF